MLFDLLVLLALTLTNAFFAGAEIAIIAVRQTRLAQLVRDGRVSARAVMRMRAEPERFLATVQIAISVIGAAAGAFGGLALTQPIAALLARAPGLAAHAQDVAFAVVVALVSYLSIVLGELVPKSLALRASERYALLMARPLLAISWLARPAVWFLTRSSNALLKPFGDRTTFAESRLSAQELQELVVEAARAGELDARTSEIASRALAFAKLTAADVMVPRNRMAAIPRGAPPKEIQRILLEEAHSRLPVYQHTLDDIVGYISIKDVLAFLWEGKLIVLEDILRPVHFTPMTAPVSQLLQEMQQRRMRLAIVVDEHGGVAGMITFEDIVEELVGEIVAEHETPEALVVRQPDGSALVRGDAPIREVNRALDLDLPEGDGWSTLGGLCVALAGHVPLRNTRLSVGSTALDVVEATPRFIRLVRVTPRASSPAEPPPP